MTNAIRFTAKIVNKKIIWVSPVNKQDWELMCCLRNTWKRMESEPVQTRAAKCQSWGLMDVTGWHAADVIKVCALSVNLRIWLHITLPLNVIHIWIQLMEDTGDMKMFISVKCLIDDRLILNKLLLNIKILIGKQI